MADNLRSQDAMTQDPAALRRRARRRLVGAIAIALVAIVVVPMLFDPDPKPLGSDVDIRIPPQESPFVPDLPAAPPAQPVPAGTDSAPPPPAATESVPAVAEPTPVSPPPKAMVPEPDKEARKPVAKPALEARKPEPVQPKSDPVFASRGYFLQLGAFSSEANAKALLAKAQAAGFKAGMTDSNGQFRVRVGPIPERDKAMDALSRLRSKGFSPVMIGP